MKKHFKHFERKLSLDEIEKYDNLRASLQKYIILVLLTRFRHYQDIGLNIGSSSTDVLLRIHYLTNFK